jgi:catechol 2,3-dioxygenase-like lactoylglutathione lyase family enzyme
MGLYDYGLELWLIGQPAGAGAMMKGRSMFLNPDHVTIGVADAGPAIAFFGLLGFRKDHVAMIDGGPPARYMGMPGMKAQHITLVLEGANPRFEIQLLEFEPTPGADAGAHPTNLRRRGFNHLAFRVDDIEAATAHLVANGVTMLSDEMDYIERKLRLFEGPEGITLELVEAELHRSPHSG